MEIERMVEDIPWANNAPHLPTTSYLRLLLLLLLLLLRVSAGAASAVSFPSCAESYMVQLLGWLCFYCALLQKMTGLQLGGSQFPPSQWMQAYDHDETEIDPRVVPRPTASTRAPIGVKNSGEGEAVAAPMSKIRKRTFRRARRRAEEHGATWYRGAWRSAQSLGTTSEQRPETNKQSAAQRLPVQQPPLAARPRLRTLTYNLGGLDPASYDVFCDWLQRQQDADIVFAQELHWGCGKTESSWNIGGWHAIICPDPVSRYSGVGIFISARVVAPEQIAYNTIIPGRLLHVRCTKTEVTLDLIAGYQHVWQERRKETIAKLRHAFWTKLGLLLHALPVRNLLVMGCDLNSGIKPVPGLIGKGVLHTERSPDPELEALLQTHHLVLLNTWGRSTPGPSHTFRNGKVKTQLDFVITRRLTADARARLARPIPFDLLPWRLGPKHRPVVTSLLWVAGWTRAKPKRKGGCSMLHLRQAALGEGVVAQQLQDIVRQALAALPDSPEQQLLSLNQQVLARCAPLFPNRSSGCTGKELHRCHVATTQGPQKLGTSLEPCYRLGSLAALQCL